MNKPDSLNELYGPTEGWSGEADARLAKHAISLKELTAIHYQVMTQMAEETLNAPSPLLEYFKPTPADNAAYVNAWTKDLADETEEFGGYLPEPVKYMANIQCHSPKKAALLHGICD